MQIIFVHVTVYRVGIGKIVSAPFLLFHKTSFVCQSFVLIDISRMSGCYKGLLFLRAMKTDENFIITLNNLLVIQVYEYNNADY